MVLIKALSVSYLPGILLLYAVVMLAQAPPNVPFVWIFWVALFMVFLLFLGGAFQYVQTSEARVSRLETRRELRDVKEELRNLRLELLQEREINYKLRVENEAVLLAVGEREKEIRQLRGQR